MAFDFGAILLAMFLVLLCLWLILLVFEFSTLVTIHVRKTGISSCWDPTVLPWYMHNWIHLWCPATSTSKCPREALHWCYSFNHIWRRSCPYSSFCPWPCARTAFDSWWVLVKPSWDPKHSHILCFSPCEKVFVCLWDIHTFNEWQDTRPTCSKV